MINETVEQLKERLKGARCYKCIHYDPREWGTCKLNPPKKFWFWSSRPDVGAYDRCGSFVKRQDYDEE